MARKDILTRILAVVGTVLVSFPIWTTVAISVAGFIVSRTFRFDYLMPAELFPVAFAGGGLLLWAALRAHARRSLIGWGLEIAAGWLIAGQVIAVVTGLASGETEPAGWLWGLVLASLIIYALALLELEVAGVLLVHDLFQQDDRGGNPTLTALSSRGR